MIFSSRKVESGSQCFDVVFVVVLVLGIFSAEVAATTVTAEYDFENYKVIQLKKKLILKCTVPESPQATVTWRKDKDTLANSERITITSEPPVFRLTIDKATDADAGNYTCQVSQNQTKASGFKDIFVVSLPTASLDSDTIVVEGEKLTLNCHPTGTAPLNITWTVGLNTTIISTNENYDLSEYGKLQIMAARMSDRGDYKCVVTNLVTAFGNYTEVSAMTTVRVKDKLAALWPFLGICAEVFVLCAIILIYEKKRNKAELDESDTDNSPEQKNTPDHGKDSVRQRK